MNRYEEALHDQAIKDMEKVIAELRKKTLVEMSGGNKPVRTPISPRWGLHHWEEE